MNDDDKSKLDVRDLQPEKFNHIKREFFEFDEFDDYQKCANKFKETLCSFQGGLKGSFFDTVLYELLFKFSEENKIDKEKVEEILGKEFFNKLKKKQKKQDILQLYQSLDNF